MQATAQRGVSSPASWYQDLLGTEAAAATDGRAHPLIKRFVDAPGTFAQPPLNANVVALHLGGAKRVHRAQGRRRWVQDVAAGSMTLMPAFQANQWHTKGPIDFAHLEISIGTAEQIIVEEFDREPATHHLHETIGLEDPLLEHVFRALLGLLERKPRGRLHMEALLTVFAVSLYERHSTLCARDARSEGQRSPGQRRGGLAGWQLRRIVDHMHGHLGDDIPLNALAELAGLSRAHFFRAFRQSTGRSPGQFLSDIRMRQAMRLLDTTTMPMDEIASALGFGHARHFASAFAARTGLSPRAYRISRQ